MSEDQFQTLKQMIESMRNSMEARFEQIDGRFEQVGTPQDLYHQPQTPFVAGFVGDSNQWQGKVTHCEGDQVEVMTDSGLTLKARGVGHSLPTQGQQTTIFVRPEAISISQNQQAEHEFGSGAVNRLQVVVESSLFNGANSRVLARSGEGQLIEVDLPQRGEHTQLKKDDTIWLTWAQSQSLCFLAQGA